MTNIAAANTAHSPTRIRTLDRMAFFFGFGNLTLDRSVAWRRGSDDILERLCLMEPATSQRRRLPKADPWRVAQRATLTERISSGRRSAC